MLLQFYIDNIFLCLKTNNGFRFINKMKIMIVGMRFSMDLRCNKLN